MLAKARKAIARADLEDSIRVTQADAVNFPTMLFGEKPFQRIYLSYTLSMIPDWIAALERAAEAIPPGGSLLIADFGDQRDLPAWFRFLLHRWLAIFDVMPLNDLEKVMRRVAGERGLHCDFHRLYRGYTFIAALRRARD